MRRAFRLAFAPLLVLAGVGIPLVRPQPAAPAGQPDATTSALARALDTEIERAEEHSRELARFEKDLADRRRSEDAGIEEATERIAELSGRLQIFTPGSAEVDTLYDQIVVELKRTRPRLAAALDAVNRPLDLPEFSAQLDVTALDARSVAARVTRLKQLIADNSANGRHIRALEEDLRWTLVDRWASTVKRLNDLRIAGLHDLTRTRRRAVLGLTRAGREQLQREIAQLRLSARVYLVRTRHAIEHVLPTMFQDASTLGAFAWTLLKVLAVAIAYLFLRRRAAQTRRAVWALTRQAERGRRGPSRWRTLFEIGEVLAPWGSFLLLLFVLRWSLGSVAARPEVDLPLRVALLYGLYRLAIDVLFAGSVRLARRYRLKLDEGRTAEVLRTVRTLMRVVVAILVLLAISARFLGKGYLYVAVLRFAGFAALGVGFLLLARWRPVIADTYLAMRGTGRLASMVRGSRDHWYGIFVSAAAFVLLAGRGGVGIGQDFAMGFEQTRRALAFVFLRRVQKQAERAGYADGDTSGLPAPLVEALSEEPVSRGPLAIEYFPGLDILSRMIAPWRNDDVGASFLLSGEKGTGKTSWLGRIDPGETPISTCLLETRVQTPARLTHLLAAALGLPAAAGTGPGELRKALLAGTKRIVVVDLAQNLFLSTVGGYDTFEAFVTLVEATCENVFWICSVSAFACDHIFAVRPDLMVFRHRQVLPAWTEERIGELLRTRTAAAGATVTFDDLLTDGRYYAGERGRQIETEAGYVRLLWNYSDGNPRTALHFWTRSLVPGPAGRLRVRLFRAPAAEELEVLSQQSRFLLAAIVVHENLSLQEAAIVTRSSAAICRIHLNRLEDRGLLRREKGRYRLTTHWHRAVLRFLKRGNMISD